MRNALDIGIFASLRLPLFYGSAPPGPHEGDFGLERWLLLSNCMTPGLANCFTLMNPDLTVEAADIHMFQQYEDRYRSRLGKYDRVIINPGFPALVEDAELRKRPVHLLPAVHFDAFHPDICVATSGDEVLSGPMGHYNSVIALAAFTRGLSVRQTLPLYARPTYEAAGYFSRWNSQREEVIATYAQYGVDVRASFLRWSNQRHAFMYSMNHPRIEVVYDVARAFLESLGMPVLTNDLRPPDNLLNGPCYPIYPEIAEDRGVSGGSYLFKLVNQYRLDNLEQFVTASFANFATCTVRPVPMPYSVERFDRVLAAIDGGAA